jgi:hypothetical protein
LNVWLYVGISRYGAVDWDGPSVVSGSTGPARDSMASQVTETDQLARAQSFLCLVQVFPLLSRTVRKFSGIGSPVLSTGASLIGMRVGRIGLPGYSGRRREGGRVCNPTWSAPGLGSWAG